MTKHRATYNYPPIAWKLVGGAALVAACLITLTIGFIAGAR